MAENEEEQKDMNVLVKFFTKQRQYSVPESAVAVEANVTPTGLNKVIKAFIRQGPNPYRSLPSFEFVIKGQLLTGELRQFLEELEISIESVVRIEFFEKQPPPTPKDSLHHDDWVAALECSQGWLLTGCYDNTLHLWDAAGLAEGKGDRAHTLTIPAHRAPIKAVTWVPTHWSNTTKTFISTSIDQTAVIWVWQSDTNTVECVSECRGHTQSVECVSVCPSKSYFATGSWDNLLKIWPTTGSGSSAKAEEAEEEEDEDFRKKFRRSSSKPEKLTPVVTLAGHSESVGGVAWTSNDEIVTASWDHSIRLWDAEIGGVKNQANGNCAFFSIAWSPYNRTVLTGCADRHIRMYDPRARGGAVALQKYTSHTKWIPSVKWSRTRDCMFISGGYDNLVKLWDSRSPKMPLYDLKGHDDKVLVVDWSNPDYIISGSADCTTKAYAAG